MNYEQFFNDLESEAQQNGGVMTGHNTSFVNSDSCVNIYRNGRVFEKWLEGAKLLISCELKLLLLHFSKELRGCHHEGDLIRCLALLTGDRQAPAANEREPEAKCL